jgi:exodeoxyribonuclease VII small subunit
MAKKANTQTEIALEDLTFEQAMRQLDEIVAKLEQGDLTLEQTLALHTRGQQLAALCAKQLDQAELKVRKLDE